METMSRCVSSPAPLKCSTSIALSFQNRSCAMRGRRGAAIPHSKLQVRAQAETQMERGVVAAGVSIAAAFFVAFSTVAPASARSGEIDLPPIEPEVATMSSSKEINLAKQLKAIGAKMYGAFWCSHCFEQKQMFGKEALKFIEYVECYPEGYRRGVKLAAACSAANIQGFPTWVINGEQYSGEQKLERLAELSGLPVAQMMK